MTGQAYWEEVFSTSSRRQESLPTAIDLEIKMLGKYADIPIPRSHVIHPRPRARTQLGGPPCP